MHQYLIVHIIGVHLLLITKFVIESRSAFDIVYLAVMGLVCNLFGFFLCLSLHTRYFANNSTSIQL